MPSSDARSLIDKLRVNLRAAGIPAAQADEERILEDGSLARMEEYLRVLRDPAGDVPPDYLSPDYVPRGYVRADDPDTASIELPAAEGSTRAAATSSGSDLPDSIADVAVLLRERAVSPVELVGRALERIAERDAELNAFQLVLVERARAAAREAEVEIGRGEWRGPLHGVPVAVKDLFAMRGTVTTAGSRRTMWPPEAEDAVAIERLERAGAVIVGKTRLPEFAFWPGSINPHYGPTANPHDLGRDAGGSSSGSAVAVADGMAYAALGSDTGGSIRIPAALCGVVGFKPTYGRVSLEGCVPLAWSLDHAGPLTRTVQDAALLLEALGRGGGEPPSAAAAGESPRADVRGLRIGVLRGDGTDRALATNEAVEAWARSLRALEGAGATLVDIELPEMAALRAVNFLILSAEASAYHASGLRSHYEDYGEPCRSRLLAGFAYGADDLLQAQRVRRVVRRRWEAHPERFDVLGTPSQPDVAPPLGEMASVKFTSPFNALGWPAISVPFGRGSGGLPLATQLVAGPWQEATVLRAAQTIEEAR